MVYSAIATSLHNIITRSLETRCLCISDLLIWYVRQRGLTGGGGRL